MYAIMEMKTLMSIASAKWAGSAHIAWLTVKQSNSYHYLLLQPLESLLNATLIDRVLSNWNSVFMSMVELCTASSHAVPNRWVTPILRCCFCELLRIPPSASSQMDSSDIASSIWQWWLAFCWAKEQLSGLSLLWPRWMKDLHPLQL